MKDLKMKKRKQRHEDEKEQNVESKYCDRRWVKMRNWQGLGRFRCGDMGWTNKGTLIYSQ